MDDEQILGVITIKEQVGNGLFVKEYPRIIVFTNKKLIVVKRSLMGRIIGGSVGAMITFNRFSANARDRLQWGETSVYSLGDIEYEVDYSRINAITFENKKMLIYGKSYGQNVDTPDYKFLMGGSGNYPKRISEEIYSLLQEIIPDKL